MQPSPPTLPDFETLDVRLDGALARVTLTRPAVLNALSDTMLVELERVAGMLDEIEGLKVVVLAGAGRAFCAGADVGGFSGRICQ